MKNYLHLLICLESDVDLLYVLCPEDAVYLAKNLLLHFLGQKWIQFANFCLFFSGILLNLDEVTGQVWVYNRTDSDIFVNSPTLDPPNLFSVRRVPPGFCVLIFDYQVIVQMFDPALSCYSSLDGPFDPYNVCLLYTSPSPRDRQKSRMPSSA